MPYKDPEKRKEYVKKYSQKNKQRITENRKKYNQENKERIAESTKKYYQDNNEKLTEQKKEYYHKNKGRKENIERRWKRYGVKLSDDTYERFKECKNCQVCNVELTSKGKSRKVLDHDHDSGYVRFICCCSCNPKLGARDRRLDRVHKELYRYFNRR